MHMFMWDGTLMHLCMHLYNPDQNMCFTQRDFFMPLFSPHSQPKAKQTQFLNLWVSLDMFQTSIQVGSYYVNYDTTIYDYIQGPFHSACYCDSSMLLHLVICSLLASTISLYETPQLVYPFSIDDSFNFGGYNIVAFLKFSILYEMLFKPIQYEKHILTCNSFK